MVAMKRLIYAAITTGAFVILFWVLLPNAQTPSTDTRPIVGATISALADIVRQVAGDTVRVVQIIPAGADPHTFEVSPSVISSLADADIVFRVGHGIDDWTSDITDSIDGVRAVTIDDGILFRKLQYAGADEEVGSIDPHYWMSPDNAKLIASTIALELSGVYPDNNQMYDERLDTFSRSVDLTVAQVEEMLSPYAGSSIVLFHESVGYFTDAFGLTIAGVFEPHAGSEPTAQQIADLQKTVTNNHIRAVFSEPQLPDSVVQAFVQDLNVRTGVLDPGEASLKPITYQNLLLSNAQAIKTALQ